MFELPLLYLLEFLHDTDVLLQVLLSGLEILNLKKNDLIKLMLM